jgi:hypothetical protein
MRFFAFVVDRGSFACEALFQNINGFPASRRAVHLLRSEKGAGTQHPREIAARDLYQSYHNAQGDTKNSFQRQMDKFVLLHRHFMCVLTYWNVKIRRMIAKRFV